LIDNILNVDAAIFTAIALLIERDLSSLAFRLDRARENTDMLVSLSFKVLLFERHSVMR
jgi:hypothetical protein